MARAARKAASNGVAKSKKLTTQSSVDSAVWSICDVMRRGNVGSALQYVPELTWILFLRILDETEEREALEAKVLGHDYAPSLNLALNQWDANDQGLRVPADIALPLVNAPDGYARQIAALGRKVGAVGGRQTM